MPLVECGLDCQAAYTESARVKIFAFEAVNVASRTRPELRVLEIEVNIAFTAR